MKIKNFAFILVSLFISSAAHAECEPKFCVNVDVERLYPQSDGTVYFGTSGTETNLNCAAHGSKYMSFNINDVSGDMFYSTLLSAQMANKQVTVRINEGSDPCSVLYIILDKQ